MSDEQPKTLQDLTAEQLWAEFGKAHARRDALLAQIEQENKNLQAIGEQIQKMQNDEAKPA